MRTPQTLPANELQTLLTLFQSKRYGAMEERARRLLRQHPQAGLGWKALGVALLAQHKDAVGALQRAVALLPVDTELVGTLVEAHLDQGHALLKAGRTQDAVVSYTAARDMDPRHPHAHACLGVALQATGQLEAAVQSYEHAVALRPDLVDAQFCLGSCLLMLGQADAALSGLRRAIELQPRHAHAHANLGNALKMLGRLDDALPAYRTAVALEPGRALNHANLGAACRELGQMEEGLACYQRVLDLEPKRLDAASDRLFIKNYVATKTAHERKSEAQRFGVLAAEQARPFTTWHGREQDPAGKRLRVGFVSADLHEHPVGYFVEGIMAVLATAYADRIELFVYANAERGDAMTSRLRGHSHRWTSIAHLDDEVAAGVIHADAVDILVDLSGHTAGNRLPLFAWKPAPLQISWLGYCATTGLAAIDHFVADPWIAPSDADEAFTENIWRLPETFLCFTPPVAEISVGPPPATIRGHVTFGCFNKLNKLNDEVVAAWARVMRAVPQSKLLLKSGPLGMESRRADVWRRFADCGVASERVMLEGASPRNDYLRAYDRVDIALDPFPYPGGTTSVEGLWMGVPVLTLAGSCALAHQGVSILQNVGLSEWIATSEEDYVERACRHAGDVEALTVLRGQLRARLLQSPLCDSRRFATHFVQALSEMHVRR